MIRTRFAPSPTGNLHIGGARTALFNWLYAKHHGGKFILRIEDTDAQRNTQEAQQGIITGLNWLGLDWDEGPMVSDQPELYFQSNRDTIYQSYFDKLVENDHVYEDEGAWRFKFKREPVTFVDEICGEITIDYRNEDNTPDMVVRRSDGSFVFHFVNVVDDLEMEISHVIRGEDHLMNTPKHIQLIEAFGAKAPTYAHIPLILNPDGSKMSKRDQGAGLGFYQQDFLAEALINFLALLGWSNKDDQELFTLEELIQAFDLTGVNRSPAKFDLTKCLWFNAQYLRALPIQDLATLAQPRVSADFEAMGLPALTQNDTLLLQLLEPLKEKVQSVRDIAPIISFLYVDKVSYEESAMAKLAKNKFSTHDILKSLQQSWTDLEDWSTAKQVIMDVAQAQEIKAGPIMLTTRVALSGSAGGLDLGLILEILGKQTCIQRLNQAIEQWPTH